MPSKLLKGPAYPMKFKVFLRWMAPDLRHYDERLRLFRRFLYSQYKANPFFYESYSAERTQAMKDRDAEKRADDLIAWMSIHGLGGPNVPVDFFTMKRAIEAWRKDRLIQQRKDAWKSRTLKNYRKKILQLITNRFLAIRNQESVVSLSKNPKKVSSRKTKSEVS